MTQTFPQEELTKASIKYPLNTYIFAPMVEINPYHVSSIICPGAKCTQLYKPLCPSVGRSVRWSIAVGSERATYGDRPCYSVADYNLTR